MWDLDSKNNPQDILRRDHTKEKLGKEIYLDQSATLIFQNTNETTTTSTSFQNCSMFHMPRLPPGEYRFNGNITWSHLVSPDGIIRWCLDGIEVGRRNVSGVLVNSKITDAIFRMVEFAKMECHITDVQALALNCKWPNLPALMRIHEVTWQVRRVR